MRLQKRIAAGLILSMSCIGVMGQRGAKAQTIVLDDKGKTQRFDGIGVVNGGGATSVLLKDYPEQQRREIMDLVYKPKFGASVSALLVEIPGDGNSTQGSMPSHSHYRGDYNYMRGYTWWVLREAKSRNHLLTLDATAWSAPGWIGGGQFWSQDAVDYYISWLQGLRKVHGLELDAIGCRNEKGESWDFAKWLKRDLVANGFEKVLLHGFDNWPKSKLDFVKAFRQDPGLGKALDVVSGHTFYSVPVTAEQRALVESLGKPIWNSEDHVYKRGFDVLISIVECFNKNYIESGVTKIVNWYDIAGMYPMEPYSCDPATILAREPWSGNYTVREALWGYAHYGQFTEAGWRYLSSACTMLEGGGSVVALKSPSGDYSVIIETKDAKAPQTLRFDLKKGMIRKSLCVWKSDSLAQFVRQADIVPRGSHYELTLEPHAVYSLSTTTGQQKGRFADVPASRPFPMPYADDFEGYGQPAQWGYLPHYTADICGAFELVERPDRQGTCIRQVVGQPTISWAPDWHHYTILGDSAWADYEVSADVWLNPQDEAAVMGHVCDVGTGYGIIAKGYYLKIDGKGNCTLVITRGKKDKKKATGDAEQQALIAVGKDTEEGGERVMDSVRIDGLRACEWHNVKLRFEGNTITGYVDGKAVVTASGSQYRRGMAGLLATKDRNRVSTPYFDNLRVTPLGTSPDTMPALWQGVQPLYAVGR